MKEFENSSLSSGDDKASFPTTEMKCPEEAAKTTRRSIAENVYQELVNEYNNTVQEKLDESRNHHYALGKESCEDKACQSVMETVHKEIFNEYSKDLQEKKKTNRSGDDKASFPTTEKKSSEEAAKTTRSVMEGWHDKFLKDCNKKMQENLNISNSTVIRCDSCRRIELQLEEEKKKKSAIEDLNECRNTLQGLVIRDYYALLKETNSTVNECKAMLSQILEQKEEEKKKHVKKSTRKVRNRKTEGERPRFHFDRRP